MSRKQIQQFLFPELNRRFLIRVLAVGIGAFVLFSYILIPFRITGFSMEPTYRDGEVNFSFALNYIFSPPERFDVVTIRLSGTRVMLLKRIVAFPGETVAFEKGYLMINGQKIAESYVSERRPWNLAPRTVKEGHVYVVGDNRNVPMNTHDFGQTPIHRITGAPLW